MKRDNAEVKRAKDNVDDLGYPLDMEEDYLAAAALPDTLQRK